MECIGKDRAAARVAERQHGLVTRDQARCCGLTDNEIAHRLAAGRWLAVRPSVFVLNGVPASWEQQVRAACLATGDVAAASDLTAGRLWGLLLPAPEVIELTTPMGRQVRLSGVRHHRRSTLHPVDIGRCGGIPTTSPARTLVDASGSVRPQRLGSVVDDALRRGLLTLGELRACHARVDTGPGRRPTVALRRVIARRGQAYDPGGSDRELKVMQILVNAGIRPPVQQHRVHIGGRYYDLDLAYPPEMVGLEFDGWEWHGSYTAFHRDRERMRRLAAAGWTMLPVTAKTDPADLVSDVKAAFGLCVRV